jgi:2-oxoglutarate ferredoxin oxidoreductase subunit beta
MSAVELLPKRVAKDYHSENRPTWCPGCGDFGVLSALYKAFAMKGLDPKDVVIVSGIGCSGRLPEFVNAYGLHGVHGRALPIAQGIKLANPKLTVVVVGGDGDGFAIGGGHVPHAVRRNIDITYIVMDNEIYGLTKGQPSPTTPAGMLAVSSSSSMGKMAPYGVLETPLNMMGMVLCYGASFAARGFSGQPNQLAELYVKAIEHKGFSFIQALSPCVTFYDTYADWKAAVTPMPETHDVTNQAAALNLAMTEDRFHLGVFYQQERPTFESSVGAVREKARGEVQPELKSLLKTYL